MEKYIIEPRCDYCIGGRCWLVAKNKATGEYVMDGKKYRRFKNSLEIEKWIAEQAEGEKE